MGYFVNQTVLFTLYDAPLEMPLPKKDADWTTALFNIRDTRLLIASLAGVEAAIISNFIWHHLWTFPGGSHHRLYWRFARFNTTSLGSPAISLLMTNTLTPYLDVHFLIANTVGIALGTAWNWLWASKVIWRQPHPAMASEESHIRRH